ncbi:MAG: hypothetical protein MI975_09665 [Cytophagales bacterium]|nr:hypothetical protein [Cytophagales bacterium]
MDFTESKNKIQITVPEAYRDDGVTILKPEVEKDAFNINPIKLENTIDTKVNTKQKIDTENL